MKESSFTYERIKLLSGFDGKECKIYPNLVKTEKYMYISYQMLLLTGSDVFNDSFFVKSIDGGKNFGAPEKLQRLETVNDGIRSNFTRSTEYYSKYHKKWFTFGSQTSYENDKQPICIGGIAVTTAGYIIRDEESGHYVGEIIPLPLPFECISAVPHAQIVECENGDFLLSFYARPKGDEKSSVIVVRYEYKDGRISIVDTGSLLGYPQGKRGIVEPSIAKAGGRYYMTLRSDEQGLFSVSDNGLDYSTPVPWKWDDGEILQNYNTMQRWIRYKDQLYLAYTRRGAHNDHVFRHRAPMFMARFDEKNQCLVKDSEVILVPELGARLGNFTVTDVSENEIWLLTAEWMQPIGCEKFGSDNSIWIAKIIFE